MSKEVAKFCDGDYTIGKDFLKDEHGNSYLPKFLDTVKDKLIQTDHDLIRNLGSDCDPFVKVLINGNSILTTKTRENTETFNVDESVTSEKVKKTDMLALEIWDDNGAEGNPIRIAIWNETIDTFINTPKHCSKYENRNEYQNCITVNVIWQDERRMMKK